jgi:hypothetical protein
MPAVRGRSFLFLFLKNREAVPYIRRDPGGFVFDPGACS